MGLRLVWQPCPLCPALYTVSLRRLGTLPAASFRFHLSVDTLAVRLTLPTTKCVVDFHHQAIAHAGRTAQGRKTFPSSAPMVVMIWILFYSAAAGSASSGTASIRKSIVVSPCTSSNSNVPSVSFATPNIYVVFLSTGSVTVRMPSTNVIGIGISASAV